jgi:hypothetical protein
MATRIDGISLSCRNVCVEGEPGARANADARRVRQDVNAVGRYWSTLSFVTTGA